MLADSAYFSTHLRKKIKDKHIKPIIDVNVRNTQNKDKLKNLKRQKNEYVKNSKFRNIIENSFSWLKKYPKMNVIVEKTGKSFFGLVLLAFSLTGSKKIDFRT